MEWFNLKIAHSPVLNYIYKPGVRCFPELQPLLAVIQQKSDKVKEAFSATLEVLPSTSMISFNHLSILCYKDVFGVSTDV